MRMLALLLACHAVIACSADEDPAARQSDGGSSDAGGLPVTCSPRLRLDGLALQAALDGVTASQGLVGAQACIIACGVEWVGSTGLADLTSGRAMPLLGAYRGGSTTKTFTTVLVLQLVDEGRLSLDEAIARWFPSLPAADRITVRMLLGNRSGLYNYTDDPAMRALLLGQPERVWRPDELVAFATAHPLLYQPGTGFNYSNTNFVLAARIAELATGKSFRDLLHARILEPIGLQSTSLPPQDDLPAELVHGYTWAVTEGGAIDESYTWGPRRDATFLANYTHGWAAGAVVSTVRDQATFVRALLRGQLLPRALLDEMLATDASPVFFDDVRYGLGLVGVPTELGFAHGHGGQTFGYQTWMLDIPSADLTLVVSANDDHFGIASIDALVTAMARAAAP